MDQPAPQPSIIARKLQHARQEGLPERRERAALGALRLGLARAADQDMGLALGVIGATQDRVAVGDLGTVLMPNHLLLLLRNPGGSIGLAALSPSFVAALVQMQTAGRVLGNTEERAYSTTDVALAVSGELCMLVQDRACLDGYRYTTRCADLRSAALALDLDRYRVFNLTLDIAAGQSQGELRLILPEAPDPAFPAREDPAPGRSLADAMQGAQAQLQAVLCKVSVPLSDLQQKQAGDLLVLPVLPRKLTETELITISGQVLAAGQLGQSAGLRALRITTTPQTDPIPFERAQTPSRKDMPDLAPIKEPPPPSAPSTPQDPAHIAKEIEALAGLAPEGG